jgi:hypothetical protein
MHTGLFCRSRNFLNLVLKNIARRTIEGYISKNNATGTIQE